MADGGVREFCRLMRGAVGALREALVALGGPLAGPEDVEEAAVHLRAAETLAYAAAYTGGVADPAAMADELADLAVIASTAPCLARLAGAGVALADSVVEGLRRSLAALADELEAYLKVCEGEGDGLGEADAADNR